jgi:glycosyltransferase involved in cell wall biosynthesis
MQGSSQNYVNLSLVMPVFNKRGTQENMLRVVLNEPCVAEVIAVDEHSTVGSFELLESLAKHESRIKFLCYESHRGRALPCEQASAKPLRTRANPGHRS